MFFYGHHFGLRKINILKIDEGKPEILIETVLDLPGNISRHLRKQRPTQQINCASPLLTFSLSLTKRKTTTKKKKT